VSAAPVVLDDVAYADLLGAAIERIPAASQGRWTLHAPVDPGITLLELFAHLLDQRVYWLDQESAEQLRAVLALLGEAPAHSSAAATVVRLVDRSSGAPTASRAVPAGAVLELAAQGAATRFTTTGPATVLPVAAVGVTAGGADHTAELLRGAGVPLLRADGKPDAAALTLTLRAAPQPGDNKISQADAKGRLEAAGYANVSNLRLDGDGIWRGVGVKEGKSVDVSLDYQGNIFPR